MPTDNPPRRRRPVRFRRVLRAVHDIGLEVDRVVVEREKVSIVMNRRAPTEADGTGNPWDSVLTDHAS